MQTTNTQNFLCHFTNISLKILEMSTGIYFLNIFTLSLFVGTLVNVNCIPCEDSRCKTGQCNATGSCICNLPDPSTILDGDRPFLGGRFCDEEMTMCDGSNSFWCENRGTCEEIVQGENYTCKCHPGYTGTRCENPGAPCGRIFCFHEAECLVEGDLCECPPDWKGSVDCSIPTKTLADTTKNSMTTKLPNEESTHQSTNWMVVVLAISFLVGGVAWGAIYTKRLFCKKETADPKFQELSQLQTHGILDDSEDDALVPDRIFNDNSHL
ncbi:EGF domain-containing protein [Cephalotus follicularis]|uniref:EGF domain-containing protein n=1 Tax=Cephalotus follicularis TaxID=3775 RepID=A0A1Q3CHC6_CEPFO|nr:EGF domain-containing protein [Cephalotus follicularis]